jgi:8-oxo-dGTP pyrophosphatase MutT (NUDIX family)
MTQSKDPRQIALRVQLGESNLVQSTDPRHLAAMCALADSEAYVFSRDHYFPGHFTASAFVLSPLRDQLLLIRHKKLGMWLQPGGHIEPTDRDLLGAARREVQEETGLSDVTVESTLFDLDVHQIPAWQDTPAHLHHDIRILLVAQTSDVLGADDAAEARWFSLEELAGNHGQLAAGCGTDDSVRRVAKRLLTLHHM